jgi:hypothetical protein
MINKIVGASIVGVTFIYQSLQGAFPSDFEGWVVFVGGIVTGSIVASYKYFIK